jgi:hypothetical protein
MAVGLPMGKLGRFWINFLFFCRISNESLMVADGGGIAGMMVVEE